VVPYPFPQVTFVIREEETGKRTDETAHLWTVFVESKEVMRELGESQAVLCNIQYVRVDVNVVNSAGVDLQNFFELLLCGGEILGWTFHRWAPMRERGGLLTMQMVEYVSPEAHDPETSREIIWTKEIVTKAELVFGRLVERIERAYLEQIDQRVGRGYW
jgi:hypothetical protein